MFQIVIYLDDSGSWLHDAINEFQAGCVGFPKGLCGFFDIYINPAFNAFWIFGKATNKNRINA